MVIKHNTPRTKLFVPTPENCPIPLKFIDVLRMTRTDLDNNAERSVADLYTDGQTALSDEWIGSTTFNILSPPLEKGYDLVEGRPTKRTTTTRPGNIWVEVWQDMTAKQKQEAIAEWEKEGPRRRHAREKAGIQATETMATVKPEDLDEFVDIMSEKRKIYEIKSAPAMLCTSTIPPDHHIATLAKEAQHAEAQYAEEALHAETQEAEAEKQKRNKQMKSKSS